MCIIIFKKSSLLSLKIKKKKKKKKYGAHSHVRATARLVNTHYSQQRSAVRSTAHRNTINFNTKSDIKVALDCIPPTSFQ